jgi:hypothetical protein
MCDFTSMFGLLLASVRAAPVRVWCVGDSITGAGSSGFANRDGCWRAYLQQAVREQGYSVKMVGTLNSPVCPVEFDADSDGHWGYLVTEVASGNLKRPAEGTFEQWLTKSQPDIFFMHFGTNDCWNNKPVPQILGAYEKLLTTTRAKNPKVALVVCKLIGHNPAGCGDCDQRVQRLNAQMDDWAAQHATAESPIYVADCHTGFNPATDTRDGTHPNLAGMQKMAKSMAPALAKALDHFK